MPVQPDFPAECFPFSLCKLTSLISLSGIKEEMDVRRLKHSLCSLLWHKGRKWKLPGKKSNKNNTQTIPCPTLLFIPCIVQSFPTSIGQCSLSDNSWQVQQQSCCVERNSALCTSWYTSFLAPFQHEQEKKKSMSIVDAQNN